MTRYEVIIVEARQKTVSIAKVFAQNLEEAKEKLVAELATLNWTPEKEWKLVDNHGHWHGDYYAGFLKNEFGKSYISDIQEYFSPMYKYFHQHKDCIDSWVKKLSVDELPNTIRGLRERKADRGYILLHIETLRRLRA